MQLLIHAGIKVILLHVSKRGSRYSVVIILATYCSTLDRAESCYRTGNFIQTSKSKGLDSCDQPNNLTQIELKSSIFGDVWPSNLMDDLKKQEGTCSMQCQALCITSQPLVNSNWSYSPEMLNSGEKWRIFWHRVNLKFDGWLWKRIGTPSILLQALCIIS